MSERDLSAESDPPVEPERPVAAAARPRARPEPPTTPQVSRDESGEGWGDRPTGYDDDWYERERPPHHG